MRLLSSCHYAAQLGRRLFSRYYELFLAENDTGNVAFKDYSNYRISALKRIIHFDIDTLN